MRVTGKPDVMAPPRFLKHFLHQLGTAYNAIISHANISVHHNAGSDVLL